MQAASYSQTAVVNSVDCDLARRMTPGALLRRCQQISVDQCTLLGLTNEYYKQEHVAFLLAKIACRWIRPIHLDEEITLCTRPEAVKRAVYKRVTEITDAAGREVALVDSRWVLVDTETRHILRRPTPAIAAAPFAETIDRELPFTLPRPESAEPLGQQRAVYSLCDQNGHINNTRYIDLACDALPLEALSDTPVTYLCANYHNEIPAGQTFDTERARLDGGWYFACSQPQKRCFEAFLQFADPKETPGG